jgi:tetrahydromethanopterin S-methyltransferase subunit G
MTGTRVDGRSSGQILLTSIGLGSSIGAAVGAATGLYLAVVAGSLTGVVLVGFGAIVGGIPGCVLGLLTGATLVITAEGRRAAGRLESEPPGRPRLTKPTRGIGPFAAFGAVIGLDLGALSGLVIGLVVYPLTAVFAAVEGALFGLGPGVLVGVLGWVIVVATRCGRRGAA